MKKILVTFFSAFYLAAGAGAGENLQLNAISAADIKAAPGTAFAPVSAPQRQAWTPAENERFYLAGAAERARMDKEARRYVKAEKERAAVPNAFTSPAPSNVKDPSGYAALREKNEGFLGNVRYWQAQIGSCYSGLKDALGVNDIATANILLNHMRHDHWAILGELDAVRENNRRAAGWPRELSNEQLYNAGARERAAILEQAAVCASLEGRNAPENAFATPTPAGTADPAGYAGLRAGNAGLLGNIEYWRSQLTGNYGNLKAAVKANDLETARILLKYMKADSADLDNEIKAVERNNARAEKF